MGSVPDDGLAAAAGLGSLDAPIRQELYRYVVGRDGPVSREQAADAAGISRTLAAYHLDKLAEAGLLDTDYARPEGRGGPGAGRPAKRYSRGRREVAVSLPPRNYSVLAEILAAAVAEDGSDTVRTAVSTAARKAGRSVAAGPDLAAALRACGYEPAGTSDGDIELRNCPFHQLQQRYPELVCHLNLDFVQGLLEAAGASPQRAELAPRPGRCCVVVHPEEIT